MEFAQGGSTSHHKALLGIHAATILWVICYLFSFLDRGTYEFDVSALDIKHDSGCAYFIAEPFVTKFHPLTTIVGDTTNKNASKLRLLEDDKALSPAHSLHDDVRKIGQGAYSHWGRSLYFSSTDCSDVRANGHSYKAVVGAVAHPILYTFSFLPLISGLILLRFRIQDNPKLIPILNELFNSSRLAQICWVQIAAVTTLTVLSIGYLFSLWKSGETISLSIAGWFPVSDSNGYWKCANSLVEAGTFGDLSEWCQRRSIYQYFLAGLNWLGQRNMFGTLIIQCIVLCLTITLFLRHFSRYSGICGLFLALVLIFTYAANHAFPVTLTANSGLIFGAIGFALLVGGADRLKLSSILFGIVFVSIALNSRAGAFFVLPALVVWVFVFAPMLGAPRTWATTLAVIATTAGFILQWFLVTNLDGDASRSHGNFSYTLYGLAAGGKGWNYVYTAHPELFDMFPSDAERSSAIYSLAIEQLKTHPLLILEGFKNNLVLFWNGGTYGYYNLEYFRGAAKALWWLAWIPILRNYRDPFYSLIGLCSAAILASATWLLSDGGPRIFAATTIVDVAQIVIGFTFASKLVQFSLTPIQPDAKRLELSKAPTSNTQVNALGFRFDAAFAIVLFGILFIPLFVRSSGISGPKNSSCAKGESSVITIPGKGGTTYLDILPRTEVGNFLINTITRNDLLAGTPDSAWWKSDLLNFQGKSLALIQQQDASRLDFGWTYHVYSDLYLSKYHGKSIEICVASGSKRRIFDAEFKKINSINIQDPAN